MKQADEGGVGANGQCVDVVMISWGRRGNYAVACDTAFIGNLSQGQAQSGIR